MGIILLKHKLFLSTLVSIILFIGGILILQLKLKFWSYFLGIPAAQAGIILLILTFERIWRNSVDKDISQQILELSKQKLQEEKRRIIS